MNLFPWAIKWGISAAALADLQHELGLLGGYEMPEKTGESEGAVQVQVRLEAAAKGVKLFRNNVGALTDERGIPVRFGLANDNKEINKILKSADLIGWRTLTVQPHMVGWRIAQFVSREIKEAGWQYTGREREPAQLAWAGMVCAAGGDGGFAAGVGTL
jgi:hypothetical protein